MIEFREDCRTWSLRHTCFCHRRMWGGLLGWPGGVEMQRRWVGRRSTAAGCSVSVARRSCYPTVAHLRPWVARQRKSREKRPGGGDEDRARALGGAAEAATAIAVGAGDAVASAIARDEAAEEAGAGDDAVPPPAARRRADEVGRGGEEEEDELEDVVGGCHGCHPWLSISAFLTWTI